MQDEIRMRLTMAVPVPSISCCFSNHHNLFSKYRMHHRHLRNIYCLTALFASVVLLMAAAKGKEKGKMPINY
jgi:hypothetical protein